LKLARLALARLALAQFTLAQWTLVRFTPIRLTLARLILTRLTLVQLILARHWPIVAGILSAGSAVSACTAQLTIEFYADTVFGSTTFLNKTVTAAHDATVPNAALIVLTVFGDAAATTVTSTSTTTVAAAIENAATSEFGIATDPSAVAINFVCFAVAATTVFATVAAAHTIVSLTIIAPVIEAITAIIAGTRHRERHWIVIPTNVGTASVPVDIGGKAVPTSQTIWKAKVSVAIHSRFEGE
jgi:hypothetical protein